MEEILCVWTEDSISFLFLFLMLLCSFFSFSFHSVNKNDLEVPRKHHLKIRKTKATGKRRLWYPGRWKRERNSEWKKWIAFSLLPLLDLFFTNVFPCCTIYSTLNACLSFWQQLLKEEISVMKDKIEHHPDVTRFAMENLELRGKDKVTSRGFHIKIPSRRRFFRSLVFNFIQVVWSISLVWRYFSGCNQILIVLYSL